MRGTSSRLSQTSSVSDDLNQIITSFPPLSTFTQPLPNLEPYFSEIQYYSTESRQSRRNHQPNTRCSADLQDGWDNDPRLAAEFHAASVVCSTVVDQTAVETARFEE